MSIMTDSGRVAMAIAIAARPMHLAWGRGLPAWDAQPEPPPVAAIALVDEIGRRLVDEVAFVVEAADGEIAIPAGRFARSVAPTRNLYVRVAFDFADAAAEEVREIGLFVDSAMVEGLPPGQRYFAPTDLSSPGVLFQLERLRIIRSPAVRQSFELLVTI
ncbi:MAG: hypothetical protein HQL41_00855 [Alphaproteobacteria bacterium]|nr:hypothetical protein [Alphaproteobacteria bacterium]